MMNEPRINRNMISVKFSFLFIGVGVAILLERSRASTHGG
jgi:hypothetical protein